MSGTSCNGITTALVRVERARSGDRLTARFHSLRDRAYPAALRDELLAAPTLSVARLATLHARLGRAFGRALARHLERESSPRIDVVGCHGHTLFHRSRAARDGPPVSWQIGEAAEVAAALRCAVVADFRPADIAAGGEGAPLVPFGDAVLFGSDAATRRRPRICLNIGGIANVTLLDARGRPALAFDTGPGVALIDAAARRTDGRRRMDRGGALAARGSVDRGLLGRLLAHPYFRRPAPKSTGREVFDDAWVRATVRGKPRPEDLLATLTELTVESVARAIESLPVRPADVVVAGGGALNRTLMRRLGERLDPLPVVTSDRLGWPVLAREAAAFAVLAAAYVWGLPASFPGTTGCRVAPVLGKLCLPPA